MDENKAKSKGFLPISIVIIIILAVAVVMLYNKRVSTDADILSRFSKVRADLAADNLAAKQREISERYSNLFGECEDQAEYDTFVDADTRTLSITELRRALELHDGVCGQLFRQRADLTLGFVARDVIELENTANLLSNNKKRSDALEVVTYWKEILALEEENARLYGRLVDIQSEYWQAELDKLLRFITSDGREIAVGTLNYEANQKLERSNSLNTELKELREEETVFWQEKFAN